MRLLITIFFLAFGKQLSAQDYLKQLKDVDLRTFWRSDSIDIEGGKLKTEFLEPIGFIGSDYQRFYIHYTSVTKSNSDPFTYIVSGKTKVKRNICPFRGTITIKKAELFPDKEEHLLDEPEPYHYKQGRVTCDINLHEDSSRKNSGYIKGSMTTDFYLDKKNNIKYNALHFVADGFKNNQCIATWTNYKTGTSKKCNWGDFRIPESGDLDIGAGEFSVDEKYFSKGWIHI